MSYPTVVLYGNGSPKAVSYFVQRNEAYGRWVARLLGGRFAGNFDPHIRYREPVYFIPARTLVMSLQEAANLGITTPADLLGGIVPAGYVATKAITHRLVAEGAYRPQGWSEKFPIAVKNIVLPGFSVFSKEDARRATGHLLKGGDVRFKPALGRSGRGQAVIFREEELDRLLACIGEDELRQYGLVLERHLRDICTLSVGMLQLGGEYISYYGTQRFTLNNQGSVEYGGSDLFFVRGPFEQLLRLDLAGNIRLAIQQAILYDEARCHYPGVLTSRRNYDVGQGYDREGNFYSGVLEQSWRIGGATGAELYAFECFQQDPTLDVVEASTYCVFGQDAVVPPEAIIQFAGVDSGYGPMTIYTVPRGPGSEPASD